MAKRFTETKKWEDPWFQDLDPVLKCVWGFILDHCDNAGVWVVNTKLIGFMVGKNIAWDLVKKKFGNRLVEFAPGKIWVPKFIQFQYGELSPACKPHQKILGLLKSHGLLERYSKGIDTLQEEEEDKEEDKDQKEGEPGEKLAPVGYQAEFDEVRKAYPGTKRGLGPEWENFEAKFGKRIKEILPLLLPAVEVYKEQLTKKSKADGKPPFWKNFQTWINQECWTTEYPDNKRNGYKPGGHEAAIAHYLNHGFYPANTPQEWMTA